jgi:NAD(P)-dependent dehydrogenase (short-subunit alcohol dehydrogenase family)
MKNVLITGANRGLGLSLAQAFHAHGYQLFLVVRSQLSETKLIEQFKNAKVLNCDVTHDDYELKLKTWLADTEIDVLINNAGTGSKAPTLEASTTDQLRKEFDSHCVAAFSTVKGSLKALVSATQPQVINISSRRGSMTMQAEGAAKGSGCSYSYRIGKAAQNMLTLCLADELEDQNITIASIHPGRLKTDMAANDANLTADESARKILELVIQKSLKNRDFINIESGTLPW